MSLRRPENVNKLDHYGHTALANAAWSGNANKVRNLLNRGARTNIGDVHPLTQAVRQGHTSIARMLINKGANVNWRRGADDMTPLMWAAYQGHVGVARLLIQAGANLNARMSHGTTALGFALVNEREGVARLLIEAGATMNRNLVERLNQGASWHANKKKRRLNLFLNLLALVQALTSLYTTNFFGSHLELTQ